MPLTLIWTLDKNNNTSFSAYSLIFPYYIAGKDYYAMVFECTWIKELGHAENDKIEEEYLSPCHDFNGITSKYGAHFIL